MWEWARIYEVCFLEEKSYLIPSQYHDLHVHSSKISKGSWKSGPQKHQGFLMENWSHTWVDGGEGNLGRNKSGIFILSLPESQNQSWNFVVPALSCASQSFYTDGSGLRIRHFIHQRERGPVPVPALPVLVPKYTLQPEKMRTNRRWF